ncbi:MAG: VWA domain-containing protein [Acidobacteria bacterium]|nr:VWA domain-containing protein [Acidobacteriota bacterium]
MRHLLVFIVAILAWLPLQAQRPPVFRASTEQVVVPVTVKDAQGRLIGGLEAADFRLLEDAVEQKITGFSADPASLSVAVLIDAALSRPTAHRLRATFPSLAEAFSEFDEAGVFAFDVRFRTVADFTSDRDRIYEALKQMEIGAEYSQAGEPLSAPTPRINGWPVGGPPPSVRSGGAAPPMFKNVDDAVYAAARLLRARDPGRRKMILLISDGLNSTRNQVSTSDLLATLRKSGVGVYSIGLDDAKLSRNISVLARYGPPSGGEMFTVLKKTSIEPVYARITEQARYQYILTYVPQKPPTVAPVFRSIEVRVKRPAVTVIARDGYIPEPRAPQP